MALVGAYLDDQAAAMNAGAAYVFIKNTTWGQDAKIIAPDPQANANFGFSVALEASNNNSTAAISAWKYDSAPLTDLGSVYVFHDDGATWTLETQLLGQGTLGADHFGNSLGISGSALIVGAYRLDIPDPLVLDAGAAYIFRRNGILWGLDTVMGAAEPVEGDQFGFAVDISGDVGIVGVWEDDTDEGEDSGSVYLPQAVAAIDCNKNGTPDDCDILDGTSLDVNLNGIPDECEKPIGCVADIAPDGGDGEVNVDDLLVLIGSWDVCPAPPTACPADIAPPPTGDGTVNVDDLLALIAAWGPCP